MRFRLLEDAEVKGRRALVRVDFNVPMADGQVTDDTRLRSALPTIQYLQAHGAKVILAAHFDRPKGKRVASMSLAPVVPALSALLKTPVAFAQDCVGESVAAAIESLPPSGVILLENTRFHSGEEANCGELSAGLAALADLYVNDAFSAAHRAHASTEGVARILPAFAGKAMQRELEHLDRALGAPERPVLAVVGGAKVSTKIDLLQNLVRRVDVLAVGGGMANTFLAAQGVEIGKSLCERDHLATALTIMETASRHKCRILLPEDVVAATEFRANAQHRVCLASDVKPNEMILDAGPKAVAALAAAMEISKTVIWNGPLGAFETPPFQRATVQAAQIAGKLAKAGRIVAVAGGGDTVAALNMAGAAADFTFVSTAGGAFLEWMEGKPLPGVEALKTA